MTVKSDNKRLSISAVAPLAVLILGLMAWSKIKPVNADKEINPQGNIRNRPREDEPILATELGKPHPIAHQGQTHKKRRKVPDWLKFTVNFLALAAVTWYAYEARKQRVTMDNTLDQVQNQTTTLRQQLIGTQAATIETFAPTWLPTTKEVTFTFKNTNPTGVIGKVTGIQIRLQRITWPGEKLIGKPFVFASNVPEVFLKGQDAWGINRNLPWPLPPKLSDQSKWPGDEFVTFEGDFVYDDGFGEKIPEKFCYLWLPEWTLGVPGNSRTNGGWIGGKEGCPAIQEKITEFRGVSEYYKQLANH